jgi:hypothetical protein
MYSSVFIPKYGDNIFLSENGYSVFLRNVGIYLQFYMGSQPRRQHSNATSFLMLFLTPLGKEGIEIAGLNSTVYGSV